MKVIFESVNFATNQTFQKDLFEKARDLYEALEWRLYGRKWGPPREQLGKIDG